MNDAVHRKLWHQLATGTVPLAAMALLGLVSCTLNREGLREVSAVVSDHERARSSHAERYGTLPVVARSATPETDANPPPALAPDGTLAGLIALGLERNPDLIAAINMAQAAAHRVPQATALMDPMLMMRYLPEPIRTADGDNFFVLGVEQTLPIPHKLDRRGREALAETRMAIQMLEETRLRVVAEIKRAYFELFAIDRAIAIARENQALLRDLIEVERGQLVAGQGMQQDVLRAQVELSDLERQLRALDQRRQTTVALINALVDRPPATEVAVPEDYDIRTLRPRLDELLARAYERNPELQRIEHQIERDEQSLRLAKLEFVPDFKVGFEWMYMRPREAFQPPRDPETGRRPAVSMMSEEGVDSWAITFGFNVPIWAQRIRGGIHEKQEQLAASRRQLTAAKNRITYEVQDALARIDAEREIAALYATAVIPQAEQAFQVSREGYIAGTSDFQIVIDNWQRWLFFRLEYYQTLGDLERSVTDLEQAVGVSVIEANEPRPTDEPANGG